MYVSFMDILAYTVIRKSGGDGRGGRKSRIVEYISRPIPCGRTNATIAEYDERAS